MLELLSPVGSAAHLERAIAFGADAVYLGLENFNARIKADNFQRDDICDCVRRAHLFGVKVYVTFNTLVKNCEMADALDLVRTAYLAGADAFIVQDLGLAQNIKKAFPNAVLHASTQLGVHNLEGARIAEKFGFSRVVLSRETKIEDIKAIKKNTSLEIECFVQGALCVAFSGNCYLSSVERGASGNRGVCKQLCRLPYVMRAGDREEKGFMLSAKDLCLANSVRELADAGVCSFKIEGRLRRDEYVAETAKVYRRILDEIEKGDNPKLSKKEKDAVRISFVRGNEYLERGYLDKGTPSVIEKTYGNHTGLFVGVVKDVKPFKADLFRVIVSSNRPLEKGDGLKFFDGRKEIASLGIGDLEDKGDGTYCFVTKTKVEKGWSVNLISSGAQENAPCKVSLPINVFVKANAGEPLEMSAVCTVKGKTVGASVKGDLCEKARNCPVSKEEIALQASKAGQDFSVCECEVETDGVFVAKSVLNALRRKVIDELAAKIVEEFAPFARVDEDAYAEILSACKTHTDGELEIANQKFFAGTREIVFVDEKNICDVAKDLAGDVRRVHGKLVVLCPSEYCVSEVQKMIDNLPKCKIALKLPIISNGEDMTVLRKLLADLPCIDMLVSENIGGLCFAGERAVIAGAGHNAFNSFAKDALLELGAAGVLPSIETAARNGILGREIPLMTFAHCPYKTLFENDCKKCTYCGDMTLARENGRYGIERVKVKNCYFGLYEV